MGLKEIVGCDKLIADYQNVLSPMESETASHACLLMSRQVHLSPLQHAGPEEDNTGMIPIRLAQAPENTPEGSCWADRASALLSVHLKSPPVHTVPLTSYTESVPPPNLEVIGNGNTTRYFQ